jgi:putative membrane protein
MSLAAMTLVFSFTTKAHAAPSENEIADIVHTANDMEIKAAKGAKSQATNPEVKEFAQHMITAHETNNKEIKEVTKKEKIRPRSNETSKDIKKDASSKWSDIKKMEGAAFDKAYIDQQVAMHQQLLQDLENIYIPAATNADFKDFLTKTKDHVQQHLSEAQNIQSHITK